MKLKRAAVLATVFIAGCAGTPDATYTSTEISRGMNYEEIFVMLSDYEMEREFRGNVTALQFCSTADSAIPLLGGAGNDAEYVIVWFIGDLVEGVTQYYREIPDGERCGWFFNEVDWAQAPDAVKTELYIE